MQHYYFHLHNRVGFVSDDEGKPLPNLDQAREQARREIRAILSEEVKEGVIDLTGRVEIAGDGGDILAVVPFAQAVELRTDPDAA